MSPSSRRKWGGKEASRKKGKEGNPKMGKIQGKDGEGLSQSAPKGDGTKI